MISWSSGPLLGNARAGAAASLFGLARVGLRRRRARRRGLGGARARAAALLELRLERREAERARARRSPRAACRTRSAGTGCSALRRRCENTEVGIATTPARCGSSRANSVASRADVGVGEVRALRARDREAGRASAGAQVVALGLQLVRERGVPVVVQAQRGRARVLERRRAREGQELLGRAHRRRPAPPGPVAQPTFQPVTLNVLPSEEIVSVRSAMPGSVASGMCSSPSKTRCS